MNFKIKTFITTLLGVIIIGGSFSGLVYVAKHYPTTTLIGVSCLIGIGIFCLIYEEIYNLLDNK